MPSPSSPTTWPSPRKQALFAGRRGPGAAGYRGASLIRNEVPLYPCGAGSPRRVASPDEGVVSVHKYMSWLELSGVWGVVVPMHW